MRHRRSGPNGPSSVLRRPTGPSRRGFLGGSAAMLLLAACGADSESEDALGLTLDGIDDDPETIPQAPQPRFPLGVASGDVSTAGAVLWTRYTGTAALFAAVWEMDGDDYVERVALVPVTPAGGGFAHVDVAELTPGARHRYVFVELSGGQAVART